MQGVGSEENTTTPTSGKEEDGTAIYGQIKGTSIVFIKDVSKIWTHGKVYDGSTINVNAIPDGSIAATKLAEDVTVVFEDKFSELLKGYIPFSRDFNTDFNKDFAI